MAIKRTLTSGHRLSIQGIDCLEVYGLEFYRGLMVHGFFDLGPFEPATVYRRDGVCVKQL